MYFDGKVQLRERRSAYRITIGEGKIALSVGGKLGKVYN